MAENRVAACAITPQRNFAKPLSHIHDGAFGTLSQVIAFCDQGGAGLAGQDPRNRALDLNPQEREDLEAFLRSLTSPDLDCLTAQARIMQPDNN